MLKDFCLPFEPLQWDWPSQSRRLLEASRWLRVESLADTFVLLHLCGWICTSRLSESSSEGRGGLAFLRLHGLICRPRWSRCHCAWSIGLCVDLWGRGRWLDYQTSHEIAERHALDFDGGCLLGKPTSPEKSNDHRSVLISLLFFCDLSLSYSHYSLSEKCNHHLFRNHGPDFRFVDLKLELQLPSRASADWRDLSNLIWSARWFHFRS